MARSPQAARSVREARADKRKSLPTGNAAPIRPVAIYVFGLLRSSRDCPWRFTGDSLSATSISIAFVIEGQTVRLGDPNQWRAAIQNGDLGPATRVVAEEDGHRIYSGAASGFAPVAELFEDLPQGEGPPSDVEIVETTDPTAPEPVEPASAVEPA